MPDWLSDPQVTLDLVWTTIAVRLTLALIFGLAVGGVYLATQSRPGRGSHILVTTLVLLTILVAMTTIVIGDNLARAFGLVGALSIVRFRTVVDDTRDTSFVIFAVVVGMALGAGNLLACLVGVPVVSLAAIGLSRAGVLMGNGAERRLEIRLGAGHEPESLLAAAFAEHFKRSRLLSVVSARQGTAFDLAYAVELRDPAAVLASVKAIHLLEGVQSVELKEPA